ncbi:Pyruvate kinase 2, cytosolic [Glycine max]|nr:Pyruvate kinase 2, cytosolic [Glycine max]
MCCSCLIFSDFTKNHIKKLFRCSNRTDSCLSEKIMQAVKKGDTIFIGKYLFTRSETASVWLEVSEEKGEDVTCLVISTWGVRNNIDFLSLYTRHVEDIRHAREFLSKLGDRKQTHIYAKIENTEGLQHFDEILREADSIILARGNLGIELPSEKAAIYKCNMVGKPVVVTRVVDSMTDNLRPTRAEATDVAKQCWMNSPRQDKFRLGKFELDQLAQASQISPGRVLRDRHELPLLVVGPPHGEENFNQSGIFKTHFEDSVENETSNPPFMVSSR